MVYIKIKSKRLCLSNILGAYQSQNLVPIYECKWNIYLLSLSHMHLPIIPLEDNVTSVIYHIFTKPLPDNCFLYQFTLYWDFFK